MHVIYLIVFMHMLVFRFTDSIRMVNREMRGGRVGKCVLGKVVMGMDS
jgi:hypothetical protein